MKVLKRRILLLDDITHNKDKLYGEFKKDFVR